MNREKINEARAKITKESEDIGGALAIFIEEYVNSFCTNDAVADSILSKNLKDLISNIEKKARDIARQKGSGHQSTYITHEEVEEMAEEFYQLQGKPMRRKASSSPDKVDVLDLI